MMALLKPTFLFLFLLFSANSNAILITGEYSKVSSNTYEIDYEIFNVFEGDLGQPPIFVEWFSIFFEKDYYKNIEIVDTPDSWDAFASDPIAEFDEPGLYDALSDFGGIFPGETLSGFKLRFDYDGPSNMSDSQYFEVYDYFTMEQLWGGFITLVESEGDGPGNGSPDVVEVSEPNSVALLLLALVVLTIKRVFNQGAIPIYFALPLCLLSLSSSATSASEMPLISVTDVNVTYKERVSRFDFRYHFKVSAYSDYFHPVDNVVIELETNNQRVELINKSANISEINPGATSETYNSFIVQINRRYPFDFEDLIFKASGDIRIPEGDIQGDDFDNNGLRDDVDEYLNSLSVSQVQYDVLKRSAISFQDSLVVGSLSKTGAMNVASKISSDVECIFHHFDDPSNTISLLELKVVNTPGRIVRYERFNSYLSGETFSYVPMNIDECGG